MNKIQFSEEGLDKLIADVESTLAKAESLAKSSSLKKDDEDAEQDAQSAQAAPPAQAPSAPADAAPAMDAAAPAQEDAAPEMDAAAPAQDEAPADAPAMDAAPADADAGQAAPQDEQALEGEADAPLSDDELNEIYSSMAPDELERHYMILRQHMQQAYAKAEADESKEDEKEEEECEEKEEATEKSEDKAQMAALKKQVEEQNKALEAVTKAFEILAKPQRKSVTDLQFIAKSEFDGNESKEMTKDDISTWNKKNVDGLSKAERNTFNAFFLDGKGKQEIEKIIHSKGGNK